MTDAMTTTDEMKSARSLRLPVQAAPVDRKPSAAALNVDAGVEASFGIFDMLKPLFG